MQRKGTNSTYWCVIMSLFTSDMNLQSLIWFDDDLLTMNIMKYDGTKRRILLNNVPKIVYASLDILVMM